MPEIIKYKLYDWQVKLVNLLNEPDRRTINWIVDTKGNKGKTTLCKHFIENYEDVIYFSGGKSTDIASQILLAEFDPKICLFDFLDPKMDLFLMKLLKI